MSAKSISIVVLTENGSLALDAMRADFEKQLTELDAQLSTDFDSVAAEINTYLLANPGLRTLKTATLVRNIWEARVENGDFVKGVDEKPETFRARKDAAFTRLEEVLPEYVKSATDRFHVGRKQGIAFYFVEGETAKDKDGNVLYNANQEEVQAFRHTPEEWAKLTAVKDETPAAAPSTPAAK